MKRSCCPLMIYFVLLISACAPKIQSPTTSIIKTGPEYPPWFGPVEVYPEKPDIEYMELGAILVVDPNKQPRVDLVAIQQKMAASIGANAIIIHHGTSTTTGMGSEKTEHQLTATAIRIKSDWTPPDESDSRIEMTPWPASGDEY